MTTSTERLCEWDSLPNPRFNLYTIGNSSEVIPGVIRPLIAGLFQRIDAGSARAIAEQLDLLDVVPCLPPPHANWVGVIGGRAALSITWFATLMGAWQLGEGGGAWDQYLSATDGHDVSSQRLDDEERTRRTAAQVKALRDSLPAIAAKDREEVEALAARERPRDWSGMDAAALWAYVNELRAQVTEAAANHLHVSMGAGDYTDLLNKLGYDAQERIIADEVYFPTIGSSQTDPQTGFADWIQDFPNPSDFYLLMDARAIQPTNNQNFSKVDDPFIQRQLNRLNPVPATELDSVADEWSALDQYTARRAYVVVYGEETMPKFYSDKLDFDAALFHPTYLNDWTSLQLK